jgi:acyl dehydratase
MSWEAGKPLSPLTKPPITREQLKAYAHASGDMNLIHLDENFAKEAGFPTVIVHGMLSMAFLADFVAANFPAPGFRVTKLQSRFRKVTFPGDVLKCEGKVKTVGPEGELVLSISITNQRGELTTDGEARVSRA